METIEKIIECQSCGGTGVYSGMAERHGVAVVCHQCDGTGAYKYKFSYNDFTGMKERDDIKRVYKSGYGYVISTGVVEFNGVSVDMDHEGVSYSDFLEGKTPDHTKAVACPMLADQGACHKVKGFVDECEKLNDGWIGRITTCKNQCNKAECWDRFNDD